MRSDLREREATLEGLRTEWETIKHVAALPPPQVHPAWVVAKLKRLDDLMGRDPRRAKIEILKHLDGDLEIAPLLSSPGEQRAEITGRAKSDSLLSDQEAIRLQVLRGPATLNPASTSGLTPTGCSLYDALDDLADLRHFFGAVVRRLRRSRHLLWSCLYASALPCTR